MALTGNSFFGKLMLFVVIAAIILGAVTLLPHLSTVAGSDYIPLSDKHNPAHTPNHLNPQVTAMVQTVITQWTTYGPPSGPDWKCAILKLGETAVRWIFWHQTGFSTTGVPKGDLTWFDKVTWQDGYPLKSGNTVYDLPTDLRNNPDYPGAQMVPTDCDKMPPLPGLPAQ